MRSSVDEAGGEGACGRRGSQLPSACGSSSVCASLGWCLWEQLCEPQAGTTRQVSPLGQQCLDLGGEHWGHRGECQSSGGKEPPACTRIPGEEWCWCWALHHPYWVGCGAEWCSTLRTGQDAGLFLSFKRYWEAEQRRTALPGTHLEQWGVQQVLCSFTHSCITTMPEFLL